VNPNTIKEQLILFLRCDIENPAFDSQTKDYMNTPATKFGSKCDVSDKFIEKIAKMGVMETALQLTEMKDTKAAKKTDGIKTKSIRGIPKLTDANWAGTDKSKNCILLLCEGDSAKTALLSGLTSEDRNIIGIFPLKGKLLNVRGESVKKIADNKEITEIKQILGLVTGKKYITIEDIYKYLRYGKVVFVTDQDLDGSHIKGLCINLFSTEWNSLIQIAGFIGFMNTPILKAKKGQSELKFYNEGEFQQWKQQNDLKGWTFKYYKGLGTSTGKEFREYFETKNFVEFRANEVTDDVIDMVFNKKRADDRKNWLKFYDRNAYLDTSKSQVTYEEFIHRELIHFSKYDCDRSIPNMMDGLKISQRKILFSAFKRNLTAEIKVAQFSGYVSEHSGYHHGENSLNAAIVGMAQNFVGSNNINLFLPNGQFGSRLQGGKDSASERYIFTLLNKITRTIFQQPDDNILEYLNDDGLSVEPIYYAPIVPVILINGSKGIGTGFSTDIMCYNPLQIIEYLQNKLRGLNADIDFIPYYEGYKGTISKLNDDRILIKGIYEKVSEDKIRVTELPVGYWTEDFKELLEHWINPGEDKDKTKIPPIIKDYEDMSKDTTVDFTITFVKGKLEHLENAKGDYGCNGLEKLLKLYTTNTTTNMHLFDEKETLQKFDKISDIIDAYYTVRLQMYKTRKNYMIDMLEKELVKLVNKTKYIQENINDTIDLRKKKREQIIELLENKGYAKLMDSTDESEPSYKYLMKMPMDSVTEENVEKLNKERNNKQHQLNTLRDTTIYEMWLSELERFKEQYIEYKEERAKPSNGKKSITKTTKKLVKKTNLVIE
jgi:DNA topoisomerase-2